MKNMKIISKFMLIMSLFGVFALSVAVYAAWQMQRIDNNYSQLLDNESAATLAAARSNRTLQNIRAAIGELIMARDDKAAAAAEADLAQAGKALHTFLDQAIAASKGNAGLAAVASAAYKLAEQTCLPAMDAARKSRTDADIAAAQAIFFQACHPGFQQVGEQLTRETNVIGDSAINLSNGLSAQSLTTAGITIAGVIGGFVIILVIGFMLIRSSLVSPIRKLASTMQVLAGGDLSANVDGIERRDEVGEMAQAVQIFKDNGLKSRQIQSQADADRSATETERARVADEDAKRAAAMAEATSGLGEGLKQLSQGNLVFQLDKPFAVDFEGLRTDFNSAVGQLRDTLGQVANATGAIDSGSRELSESANDLSKRTEQQAASLEETAAALDQITTNVSNSTKRTEEARGVAIEATKAAQQSGEVVANAVTAMQRIEQSSSQISNIIGVIDEIAFQTNLLALNAGVEAARAGEAGKGFAVVAQEVRELAQRSAQAAKEIKELIRTSADEVESGVKLVSATGDVLKVIGDYVVSINTQLDAIATSAKEQSVGLAEVNTAVNQMDQVTQQNAAMVEEATAASAGLATESQRLRDLIQQFQIGTTSARPAGRPAATHANQASAPSPARKLMGKLAKAVGGGGGQHGGWESF